MRKKALPIGVLFMVLVVLLAAVGISYGYWQETLTADAVLNTGELDVQWSSASTTEGGTPGLASCDAWVDGGDNNLLHIQLTDAHPGYECAITAYIENTGTVPVYISVDPSEISFDGGYGDFDENEFDMQFSGCNDPIGPGQTRACSGSWAWDYGSDADNSTESRTAHYTIPVTAIQWDGSSTTPSGN